MFAAAPRPVDAVPDDAVVDVRDACRDCGIEEVLEKLDRELVGLAPVKTRIRQIAALLLTERLRKQVGLATETPTLHMCFTGNPGTGKTTVALRMAEILHRLGYVRQGHLVAVTRDDLVGQYIGHTAPKTKEVLKKAMGGVLFIDEAYYLYRPENERDYGQEAIEILLQVMENQRDDLVVILAGYKDRMDRFFQSNPGMHSRIAHHVDFPDYSAGELQQIAQRMLAQMQYRFSPGAERAFAEYLERRMRMPQFANARSVRNALDRARLRHANRIYARAGTLTKAQLMTLEADDIYASRVFREGVPDNAAPPVPESAAAKPGEPAPGPAAPAPAPVQEETNMEASTSPAAPAARSFGGAAAVPPPPGGERPRRGRAAAPPATRRVPRVENGRCAFGQCDESGGPAAEPASVAVDPGEDCGCAHAASEPPPAVAPAPARSAAGFGFGMARQRAGAPGRRTPRPAAPRPGPVPPAVAGAPQVANGRCAFGRCGPAEEAGGGNSGAAASAASREESSRAGRSAAEPGESPADGGGPASATLSGARVTGLRIGPGERTTGDDTGACRTVTGTEYLGAETFARHCATQPPAAAPKVGVMHTLGRQAVTGSAVGRSPAVTGDEAGACRGVTGAQYYNAEDFAQLCSRKGSGDPHKVSVMRTHANRAVTGTALHASERVTGSERGACERVTGTEYSDRREAEACGAAPEASPGKIGEARTWARQRVSGTVVGRSGRVTGDEAGACAAVSGTAYAGPDQYAAFCPPAAGQDAAARAAAPAGAMARAITGTQPGALGKVTGDGRGACQPVSGTPYQDAAQAAACGGEVAAAATGGFSIASPAKQAAEWQRRVTGSSMGSERITGPLELAVGLITGTPEFRHPRHASEAASPPGPARRVTGEGREAGPAITGDDWSLTGRVTGTEGFFARLRNQTRRGTARHPAAGARAGAERETPAVPPSRITGSSGNTASGAVVTLSGGARG